MAQWAITVLVKRGQRSILQLVNAMPAIHSYEVRPRKDRRGFDLISAALPFGRLWYAEPNAISNAIGYAEFYSRSHDAVIRIFDESGTVIETHEHRGNIRVSQHLII